MDKRDMLTVYDTSNNEVIVLTEVENAEIENNRNIYFHNALNGIFENRPGKEYENTYFDETYMKSLVTLYNEHKEEP